MKRYCLCINTRLYSAPCVRCVANAVRHNHHLFRQSLLSVSVLIVCVTELRTHQKPNRSNRRRSSSRRRIEKLHNKRDLHILFANSSSGNVFSTSILIRRRRSDWENMKKFVKNRLRTNKWYAKKANTDKKKTWRIKRRCIDSHRHCQHQSNQDQRVAFRASGINFPLFRPQQNNHSNHLRPWTNLVFVGCCSIWFGIFCER